MGSCGSRSNVVQPSLNPPSRPSISGFVKLALEWSRRGKMNIKFSDEPLGTQSALSQINAATCHWQSCLESGETRQDRLGLRRRRCPSEHVLCRLVSCLIRHVSHLG